MAITGKDIEKMKEVFVTKDDLKEELNRFATKEDLKRFATKEDLKDFKDEVLSGQDKIIKEFEKARENRIFAVAKDRKQDERLEGLEGRMQKIEAKVG